MSMTPETQESGFTPQQLDRWHGLLENNMDATKIARHMDSQVVRFRFMVSQLKTKALPLNLNQYLQVQGKELIHALQASGCSEDDARDLALAKMNSVANAVGVSGQVFDQIEEVLSLHRQRRMQLSSDNGIHIS